LPRAAARGQKRPTFGFTDGPSRFGARRQEELRPIGAQEHAAFLAHRFRHGQDQLIAPSGAHKSQGDAGIPAGRLNDDRVRVNHPGLFCRVNHRDANAVLNAVRRVIKLKLGRYIRNRTIGDASQHNHRCISHQLRNIFRNVHSTLHTKN
jgi:hypothetical protein